MRTEELTAKILQQNPNLDCYQLVMAVSARCDELENGAHSQLSVNTNIVKFADLALMEIAEGLVVIKGFEDKEK